MSANMSSPKVAEAGLDHKSMDGDTNGRHSHRSRSQDRKDDRDRRRDRKDGDPRRSSHDHSNREKDRRSKSRDRGHRDSRRRESSRDRHRPRDSDRDRRRKRDDEMEQNPETNDRAKRRREGSVNGHVEDDDATSMTKPRSDRSRDSDRRTVDRKDRDERDRDRDKDRDFRRNYDRRPSYQERPTFERRSPRPRRMSPGPRRPSPTYEPKQLDPDEPPPDDDSEARSIFVSQLAARLTARDLGYFFEDKLGEGAVRDSRIVTDRLSRRSKGIGYVELRSLEMVDKALALSGTIVMGLPINIQLTESERNRTHSGDGSLNLPPGVHAPLGGGAMQLYVGSLHFNLTEADIKQVFEPFGELEFVDLHKDPLTGRSKGYAFVQYKRPEDAKMALDQMEGFELAGRTLRVNTVHEKGTAIRVGGPQESLDDSGGGNLNAASRQALMQKLARTETTVKTPVVSKPNIPQVMRSECVLLRNMFNPSEETEKDWDKDLAEDVKGECKTKYGKVESIKVDKDSQGDIYVRFDSIESAAKAIEGLNGRWFGGNQVSASFISLAMLQAHQ